MFNGFRQKRFTARGCVVSLLLLVLAPVGANNLSDPTRPPGASLPGSSAKAARRPAWILSSTLISPERRSAIINGKQVLPGDAINGARVVEIHPASVKLRNRRGEFEVRLVSRQVVKKSWSQPRNTSDRK